MKRFQGESYCIVFELFRKNHQNDQFNFPPLTPEYLLKKLLLYGSMKVLFISCQKLFFSWDIYIFLLTFGYVEKCLDKKGKLNFKNLWRHQLGLIIIYTLSNIWKSRCNQTTKFGQLIEYNMKNIFLKKSYTKWDGKASPGPFYKKSKLTIFLNQKSEM